MKAVLKNQTGIEDWVLEKAAYRREGTDEVFHHPYNVGRWANLTQVINWQFQPKGDGIVWEVRKDCTQFTFTVRCCYLTCGTKAVMKCCNDHCFLVHEFFFQIEQIEQKKLKRERSLEYYVEREYEGRWFPISFGWRVCLHPPCTDEKRIALHVGDRVSVTRWKR